MSIASASSIDFDRLDKIANTSAPVEADEQVLELVERAAQVPGGLRAIVERYVPAPNVLVPRVVSFVLAQQAVAPTAETWELTRLLATRLQENDDPSTLINGLTAVQRHLIAGYPLARFSAAAPNLADFLLHCLGHGPLVRSTAIDVLARLDEDRLLVQVFPPQRADLLRRRLTDAPAAATPDQQEDLDRLQASLNGR